MLLNVFFLCEFGFWFSHIFSNRSLRSVITTLVIFGFGIMCCIKQVLIVNPVKRKTSKIAADCSVLDCHIRPTPGRLCWRCELILWTIQNVIYIYIYIFKINSRNIDGYCRSQIEYLNERFQVCIHDRYNLIIHRC